MTKFILILYICSLNTLQCNNGSVAKVEFNNHYDCAIGGYILSHDAMKELDKDKVNENKLAIKFECKPIEIIVPKPKPQV